MNTKSEINQQIELLNIKFISNILSKNNKEILKTCGKLIKLSSHIHKDKLIEIMEKAYEVINEFRTVYTSITSDLEEFVFHGDYKEAKFIQSFTENYSFICIEQMNILVESLNEAYESNYSNGNKDVLVFLKLNQCDIQRYSSEIAFSELERKRIVGLTKKNYSQLVDDLKKFNVSTVNPASLTSYLHYAIFLYEIIGDRTSAIKLLKEKHQEIIFSLDDAYVTYIDSYEIIQKLTETLTAWVIENNYGGINYLNS